MRPSWKYIGRNAKRGPRRQATTRQTGRKASKHAEWPADRLPGSNFLLGYGRTRWTRTHAESNPRISIRVIMRFHGGRYLVFMSRLHSNCADSSFPRWRLDGEENVASPTNKSRPANSWCDILRAADRRIRPSGVHVLRTDSRQSELPRFLSEFYKGIGRERLLETETSSSFRSSNRRRMRTHLISNNEP